MKDWAIEKGATHYTHLFQPMTGLTAEKHDSFLAPDRRRQGHRRVQRQGAGPRRAGRLARSPPAASAPRSRPAATPPGTRPARPFILESPNGATLVIPTAFCRGPARRSTRRPRCSARWRPCRTQALRILQAVRQRRRQEGLHHRRPRAGILPDRQELLLRPARPASTPAAPCSAPSRPRARSWRTSTSAPSPSACWPAWPRPRPSCSSSASRSRRGTTRSPRASTRSPRSSRTRNLATDHQHADDGDRCGGRPRSTAWPACCTRSRSPASTARASTTTGRCPPTPARTCSTPATRRTTTPSSWSSASPSSGPWPSTRSCSASPSPAPATTTGSGPTRPRRRSSRSSWATSSRTSIDQLETGARRRAPSRAAFMEIGVSRAAEAAARRRRPQPHQPVRLHRQQVRVPRRRLELAVDRRAEHGAEHDRRRVARLHRHAAGEGRRRAARTSTRRSRTCCRASSRRARRSSSTATTTPRSGTRRPRSAACRTCKNTVDACRSIVRKDSIELFGKYKVLQRARAAEPVRHLAARTTSRRSPSRPS